MHNLLTDHLMMVLALLLIPTTILPFFFTFSTFILALFEIVNYIIIVVFAVEYFYKLYVAKSRKVYAFDPWHILDLIIVLLAAADFLPFIYWEGGRASPLLRLLRVARAFAVAGRTVKRAAPEKTHVEGDSKISRLKASILEENKVTRDATSEQVHHYIEKQPIFFIVHKSL